LSKPLSLSRLFPILTWGRQYSKSKFADDSVAAVVVAIMLIPQSLAYALVAGMPAEAGFYASIFGLTIYAFFGSSNSLSVGPVAVVSLMTAAALSKLALTSPEDYLFAVFSLTFLSGIFLLALGILRLGFMANFISHPVISAFVTAAALIIGFSQVQHLLGISASGNNLLELLTAILGSLQDSSMLTLSIGIMAIVFILWSKSGMRNLLVALGINQSLAIILSRTGPILVAIITATLAYSLRLDQQGLQLLGDVPKGLSGFGVPKFSLGLMSNLAGSAILIAIIGFVESISVGQSLAARRRERIDLDQELVALGASNLGSSIAGGFPVSGGFSRSVVNFEAGAATPAAGLFTAILITLVALFFTPILFWLPRVCLAAIIIVAIIPLLDFSVLKRSWLYSKADFAAVTITLLLTLLVGVEFGISAGVFASIVIHLYKTSQPHVAVVGRVAGTEHFRNVNRHKVETFENLLSIRVDESLYFANARYLEELLFKLVTEKPKLQHVVLMCTAVNKIDMSALASLETINETLESLNITLHLSEVKGPIMDRLATTQFFHALTGNNYLSHNQAVEDLNDKVVVMSSA